jgi:hypothetical protein
MQRKSTLCTIVSTIKTEKEEVAELPIAGSLECPCIASG